MFVQKNMERGHTGVVTGFEYLDRWSQGSLSYYAPVTDWRPDRYGYEERSPEGLELGYGMDLTNTISLSVGAGRWESKSASEHRVDQGRLDSGWQPLPWVELRGGWDRIGTSDDSMVLHALFKMPFGGGDWSSVPWEGFGRRDQATEESNERTICRSADHVGEIEIAERSVPLLEEDGVEGVRPAHPRSYILPAPDPLR